MNESKVRPNLQGQGLQSKHQAKVDELRISVWFPLFTALHGSFTTAWLPGDPSSSPHPKKRLLQWGLSVHKQLLPSPANTHAVWLPPSHWVASLMCNGKKPSHNNQLMFKLRF